MARVLAIDIGTSSVRAALYGQSLQPVRPGAQVHYRWRIGSDGSVEAAPAAIERAVAQAIDGALEGVTARDRRRRDGGLLAQPGRRGRARTAGHVGHSVERHAQLGPGDGDARAARRARHPCAHRLPDSYDLLAGAAALVRRAGDQDLPPREAMDVVPDLSAAALARARCRELLAGLGHGHVPARGRGAAVPWDPKSCARRAR